MRELDGVNDIFASKFGFNPDVRRAIANAQKLNTRGLIDTMSGGKTVEEIEQGAIEWELEKAEDYSRDEEEER